MSNKILLTISIVIYKPKLDLLIDTLTTLIKSCKNADLTSYKIYLINNDNFIQDEIKKFISDKLEIIEGHGNIGYGSGHNLIINRIGSYHLVLNPDVKLFENTIKNSLNRMKQNTNIGLITPNTIDQDGNRQFIIRNYPSLLIFFFKSFKYKIS